MLSNFQLWQMYIKLIFPATFLSPAMDLIQNTESMEFTTYSCQYMQQSWLLVWYENTAVDILGMIQILIQNHLITWINDNSLIWELFSQIGITPVFERSIWFVCATLHTQTTHSSLIHVAVQLLLSCNKIYF